MKRARDIMTSSVITVAPDTPAAEVGTLLIHYRIHGAPVVDAAGRMVGMVSLVDLVGRAGATAADVMTTNPVTAADDTPVDELAGLILDHQVRRIPIMRGGRVVGIVSASDIIQLFLNLREWSAATPRKAVKATSGGRRAQTRPRPQPRRRRG